MWRHKHISDKRVGNSTYNGRPLWDHQNMVMFWSSYLQVNLHSIGLSLRLVPPTKDWIIFDLGSVLPKKKLGPS